MSITRTLELLPEHVQALGLQAGDQFHGRLDKDGRVHVEVVHEGAEEPPKMTGREFTAKWAGFLKDAVFEADGDPRMEYYIEKYKLNER